MKINEYVRTSNNINNPSFVAKIIKIENKKTIFGGLESWITFDNKEEGFYENTITKHSKDIIKLLEKGDICIDYNDDLYVVDHIDGDYVFTTTKVNKTTIKTLVDYQIKKVLTKQQFEANAYTIEKER